MKLVYLDLESNELVLFTKYKQGWVYEYGVFNTGWTMRAPEIFDLEFLGEL